MLQYLDIHEECPLGNDFFPSLITTGSPVHLNPGFICPSGKHRQKKSGLGRPKSGKKQYNITYYMDNTIKTVNIFYCFNASVTYKFLDNNIPTISFKMSVIRPLNPKANVTDNTDW